MRRPSRKGLSLAFVLCANIPLAAQDLHSIGREKPLSFAGGISVNQIFYASSGIASRRDPYSYFASGNFNLALYGWSVPLSFNFSNQSATFSQPFNQYSLHPAWKWITAHVGYTSMSFSPYTVNGHVFRGGGIALAPEGNWKVSALYGRFLKAAEVDTTGSTSRLPSFQRNGYALKATLGNGRNFIDLIIFRAADEQNSVAPLPDSLGITPQQNLVLSVAGGKTFFKHLLLKAEFAASAITKDTRADKTDHEHPLSKAAAFFQPRLSSSYYQAFKTSLDYQHEGLLIGLAYERIDPEYRTLGAYYFNNDLENITLNISGGLLKGKMNIAASTGSQRDNLDKTKVSSMRRIVGSVHVNYIPSERLNVAASYSSFQTYTNIRPQFQAINQLTPYDNLDTLTFTQISTNVTLSGMFTFSGRETKKQNVNVNLSWQEAADVQGQVEDHTGTAFYNLNAGYSINLIPQNMSAALTLSATVNDGPHVHTRIVGPNASISKSFFNRKLRTTLSSSWNNTYTNGEKINTVINARMNGALAIRNKHNINLSAVMVNRAIEKETHGSGFTEFTATVGYSYSFGKGK
ncbi:MAG: hypothetical protein WEB30_02225 [Cyclobacteriaceae bacterium]